MYPDSQPDQCRWVLDHIDEYLDGALTDDQSRSLAEHCGDCPTCGAELPLAAAVRDGLEALPMLACPDRVTDAVLLRASSMERLRAKDGRSAVRRALTPLRPIWRPIAVAAAVAAIVLTVVTVSIDREPAHSQADVERALQEAKYALALVSDAGRRVGIQTAEDVNTTVVAPVRDLVESDVKKEL